MFNTKIFDNNNSGGQSSPAINIPPLGASGISTNEHLNIPQPIDISYQRQSSIFNNSRFRRESIAHSQGMGGVSWGSVTIGSWLKDEVMMVGNGNNANTNAYANSHLQPHIQHHLINPRRGSVRHQQNPSISMSPPIQTSYLPDLEADYCKDYLCCGQLLPTLHDLLRHYEEAHISPTPPQDQHILNSTRNRNRNNVHNIMETVSTTDVFLNNHHHNAHNNHPNLNIPNNQFNIHQQTISQASLNNTIPQNNPIPTNQHQIQQQQQHHQQQNQHQSPIQQTQQIHQSHHQSPPQFQNMSAQSDSGTPRPDEDDAMYIDDPARHLYVMENNEYKPYKCPVIGCEKTYKNQNGLKYHRLHGHQNQTLKENPDGTISIIDPESNTPYLDGAGMEKDKPYRCEVCGKRYKNLNGLKYHRGHTTH
mmetsp:Transcript_1049/g.1052  ORF Transcript_1049/g.1052 Transcript_1049/m.1052 type:complete len:420 (-) Transcript_1049:77-1336(-)